MDCLSEFHRLFPRTILVYCHVDEAMMILFSEQCFIVVTDKMCLVNFRTISSLANGIFTVMPFPAFLFSFGLPYSRMMTSILVVCYRILFLTATVYYCMPLYTTVYHCMPLYTTVCQCMLLYAAMYYCMPLYCILCQCMLLCATLCYCMPLFTTVS